MKIAATYANGNIFPHFGHTETFKVYEVEDNRVVSSEVIPTDEAGCSTLGGFLKARGIETLLCGGIGEGALRVLSMAGITCCSGLEGDADKLLTDFLAGRLHGSTEPTCNHHSHEGGCHGHGHEDEGGCHGHNGHHCDS